MTGSPVRSFNAHGVPVSTESNVRGQDMIVSAVSSLNSGYHSKWSVQCLRSGHDCKYIPQTQCSSCVHCLCMRTVCSPPRVRRRVHCAVR